MQSLSPNLPPGTEGSNPSPSSRQSASGESVSALKSGALRQDVRATSRLSTSILARLKWCGEGRLVRSLPVGRNPIVSYR
jgi:hypothetical protein